MSTRSASSGSSRWFMIRLICFKDLNLHFASSAPIWITCASSRARQAVYCYFFPLLTANSFLLVSITGKNGWYPVRMPHGKVPWRQSGKTPYVRLDNTILPCCCWWTVKHNWAFSPLCWTWHDDWLELSLEGQHNSILGCSTVCSCAALDHLCWNLLQKEKCLWFTPWHTWYSIFGSYNCCDYWCN